MTSDMREIEDAGAAGNKRARLALDMYENRIVKYIGAYIAEMNGVDIIVFTGGVGENQMGTRWNVCKQFGYIGLKIDEKFNSTLRSKEAVMSTPDSKVKVVMIPTDEEYMIAHDTEAIVEGREVE
jgi:acetate kinase